jgi:hypothetical protein
MFEVIFFKTAAGNEPVRAWLRDLKAEERVVIGADLRTLQLGFRSVCPFAALLVTDFMR